MTKDEENYIQSINNWIKSQVILVEQVGITSRYNEQMIESHKKALELNNETIDVETKAIFDVIDGAKKWCDENNIDPSLLKVDY